MMNNIKAKPMYLKFLYAFVKIPYCLANFFCNLNGQIIAWMIGLSQIHLARYSHTFVTELPKDNVLVLH